MKYYIAFLLLLGPFCVLAQSNYYKGSVTTNDGKILQGYIDYRDWTMNPVSINFKTNLEDKKADVYTPASVSVFTIADLEKYYTYKGSISTNKINFPDLPYGKDTSSIHTSVFLRLIATGKNVTLYSFTDGIKTRFFIQENTDHIAELGYQQYYIDGSTTARSEKKYVGQLIYLINKYVQSNADAFQKIENISYQESDILSVVNIINGTTHVKRAKTSSAGAPNFRLYAGAAFSISNTMFHKEKYFENVSSANQKPQINFGFDIFTNPNVQKLVLRFDVGLSYINNTLHGNRDETTVALTPYTVHATYTFNQYNLRITPQVIYNLYNSNTLKFYIDGGAVLNISNYTNQSYTSYSTALPSYTSATSTYPTYQMESEWITCSFQTGVVFNKRIEAFFNYTLPATYAGYQDATGVYLTTSYYIVGLHYLFGKTGNKAK